MNKNPKKVPTEDEDLEAPIEEAFEKTDLMDDADFGQQEIGNDWDSGLLDEDFDEEDF